jgi:hypothetical protein
MCKYHPYSQSQSEQLRGLTTVKMAHWVVINILVALTQYMKDEGLC